jgi:serine/threonine protein kinase
MVPDNMLEQSSDQHRLQFFDREVSPTGRAIWTIKQHNTGGSSRGGGSSSSNPNQSSQQQQQQASSKIVVVPSQDPITSLMEVIRAETSRKKKYPPSETGNSPRNYELFVDLIHRMLAYDPRKRIKPEEAMNHPFVTGSASY